MISNVETPLKTGSKGLLILDRDGTIIENVPYLKDRALIKFRNGVAEGLLKAQENNFELVVATNQSGVGRNLLSIQDVHNINEELARQLSNHGVMLNQFIFCPHHPKENCTCRKPNNSMIEEILRVKRVERTKTFFIGDSATDVLAAQKSKIEPIFIGDFNSSDFNSLKNVSKVNNFRSAINLVVSRLK
jgi:D-glycero-D-manno-heptose 1,7-bisphosphate phosphatase